MSDNNNNAKTMYEAVPAAAELNKVPGFDPLKFLRRAGDSMKLDLLYQKLWFRMAHPNGRMRLTAMRITEQMAIFEAKVFLDRSDAEPFSVSVAQQTMQDSRDFVKAAQNEALSQALSDAGFGIQLVSADTHAASVQKAAPVSKTQPSAITPPVSTVLPQEPSSASQKAAVLSEGNSVSGGTQTPQRASENAETARTKIQPAATPAHEQSLPVSPTTNTDIQLQVRGDQAGDFGEIDIQQFLGLYALLLAGQEHHTGGALGGNVRKGTSQVIDSKAETNHCCES